MDDGYSRRILPLINSCPFGRLRVRRIDSQRQGVKLRRCSNCGKEGYYQNTCRNPHVDFHVGYKGDLVIVEDLLGGEAFIQWH